MVKEGGGGSNRASTAARRSGGGNAEGGDSSAEGTCTSYGGSPRGDGDGAATTLKYWRVLRALGPHGTGHGGGDAWRRCRR